MNKILFPKGIALWLKLNSQVSLQQIADFCSLDMITTDSLSSKNTLPYNPIDLGHLTQEEVEKAQNDVDHRMVNFLDLDRFTNKSSRKYIPKNYKIQKPQFIAWILHNYPRVNRKKLSSLFSTNQNFVEKIALNLDAGTQVTNPINAGFCSSNDINLLLK